MNYLLCKKIYNEKNTGIKLHWYQYKSFMLLYCQARQAKDGYTKLACCTFHVQEAYSYLSPVFCKKTKPTVRLDYFDKIITQDCIRLKETS